VLTFTPSPDRFVVEEIPAYTPSGEGAHTFLWLEKRGLTTFDAIAVVNHAGCWTQTVFTPAAVLCSVTATRPVCDPGGA